MDTYSAINRTERAIPWNSGVLQFKKRARALPRLFALDGWRDEWMMGRMDGKDDRQLQQDKT
jgi:hypothetical protein